MADIEFEFDAEHWIRGAERFPSDWQKEAIGRVRPAVETAFRIADSRVHVITGFLKSTGRYEVLAADAGEVEGRLMYEADYAIYEFGRGGEHDALTPAANEIADEFMVSMMDAAELVISTWR